MRGRNNGSSSSSNSSAPSPSRVSSFSTSSFAFFTNGFSSGGGPYNQHSSCTQTTLTYNRFKQHQNLILRQQQQQHQQQQYHHHHHHNHHHHNNHHQGSTGFQQSGIRDQGIHCNGVSAMGTPLETQQKCLRWKHYCLVGLVSALLYINTLKADFAYDDSRAIISNQDLHWSTPWTALFFNDFWGTPLSHSGSHKSYRPLCVLSYRLNYLIHQLNPAGYHLVNVILHTLVSLLFTKFANDVFNGRTVGALVAGLLFATHPIHTEAVAGIVGRADSGAAFFFLLSLMAYMRYCKYREAEQLFVFKKVSIGGHSLDLSQFYLYSSLGLGALSMLTKEYGITVLAVSCIYHLFIRCKLVPLSVDTIQSIIGEKRFSGLREGLLHLSASAIFLIGFRLYMMGLRAPDFAPADNPASDSNCFLTRTLTFLYLPVFNFWLLIYPQLLSFDWSMESIPLITSLTDPRNLVSALFYTCIFRMLKLIYEYQLQHWSSEQTAGVPCALSSTPTLNGASLSSSYHCSPCAYQHHHPHHQHHHHHHHHHHNSHHQQSHIKQMKRSLNLKSATNNNSLCNCLPDEDGMCNANGIGSISAPNGRCSPTTTALNQSMMSPNSLPCEEYLRFKWTRMDALAISLTLMVLPFIPATNLFFYVGFVVAERVLYIPSFGFCLFIGLGAESLMKRKTSRFITMIALSTLLMSFSVRTFIRNIDWLTEENLYRSGVPINPPKAYGNLANILSAQGKKKDAELAYRKALSYRTNMADVHYNLGILLQEQSRYEEALQSYKSAVQFRPRLAMAHLNMGLVLGQLGRKNEAIEVYKHCASLDGAGLKDPKTHESTRISALFNLGRLFADDGRYKEAINVYSEAIRKMPLHYQPQSLYNMMGEAYFKLGQFKEAEYWYKEALKIKHDHIPAHLTYAKLLAKWNRLEEAETWFLRGKELAPNDSSVYQHYGQFLSECERHEEAADIYLRGAQLAPNDYEIVFNAANALRQAYRNQEAEKYYKEAVRLRPKEVTSHMNLGAMLHVNGKLHEAESSYLEALKLKPDDVITQNNLAKLRHLLNQKRALGR